MQVPLGTDIRERAVRLHEMMHVKITEPWAIQQAAKEHDLPEDILQNCEDARVHGNLRRVGFSDEMKAMKGVISDFEIDQMAKHGQLIQVAALGAAMMGTGESMRLQVAVEPDEDKKYAFHAGKRIAFQAMHEPSELPEFERSIALCKKLVELFGDPGRPEEPSMTDVLPVKRIYALTDKKENKDPLEPIIKGGTDKPHEEADTWSSMEIIEPPLTVKLPQQMRVKSRKIPDATGRRLRRIGRLYHDGRVFARKQRKPGGGAVLIDVSGSMKLEAEDVLRLVEKYPGGVIATYCSKNDDYGGHGWLTVIARNGRRCEDHLMAPLGGGNGVDGPALDWIAKHPGPRFWISDAAVHGGSVGLAYCVNVCARHGIKRVDNANEILGRA